MLWQPKEDRVVKTRLHNFIRQVDKQFPLNDFSYSTLHQFSIKQPNDFWKYLVEYFGIKYAGELEPVNLDPGFNGYGWFPNVSLNFAENLLLYGEDYKIAIKSLSEDGAKQVIRYGTLKNLVARLQAHIKPSVSKDDVLACYLPNVSETVVSMLATSGLGGVFTSIGANFGVEAAVERFSQSKPKVLVACAGYQYNGKYINTLGKVADIAARLDSVESVIIVDCLTQQPDISHLKNAVFWQDAISNDPAELVFVPRKFSDPLYIMYSSGTSGKPNCIVHPVGGVLLQHVKELGLHTDHTTEKNIFFDTRCGPMMWNWLVSALFFGGTLTLYAGSPTFPCRESLLTALCREKVNILGTSPKYLKALQDSDIDLTALDFSALESVVCIGSPLQPEQFDYVYQHIKSDVMLASISGGTDIAGCFFLGNPIAPVYRGELQCRGLGMDVTCFNEEGAETNGAGELVCKQSFPSRPIYFLNDKSGEKLRNAYFDHFDSVWYQGDFVELSETGGAVILSRNTST